MSQIPFLDWVNSNITGRKTIKLNEINTDNRVFLLEEYDDLDHLDEMLSSYYIYIFEKILLSWNRNKSTWPKNLTKDIFDEWFEVEAYSCRLCRKYFSEANNSH